MNLKKEHKFYKFLWRTFESHDPTFLPSLITDILYIIIISTSLVFTVLEITEVWDRHETIFKVVEYIMVGFFAIEWIESFITIDFEYPDLPVYKRKLKWVFSLESITDLICLTVFILTVALEDKFEQIEYLDLVVLLKLVRLYKFRKYGQHSFISHKKNKKPE